jgi:redox-sensitive bicupin YhaK (pirin superfamily)
VVAGRFDDLVPPDPPARSWAARPEAAVAIWSLALDPGASFSLPAGPDFVHRTLYLFRGRAKIDGRALDAKVGITLRADARVPVAATDRPAELLLLQGKPIREPTVQHGPFVMSSPEEIQHAFADYHRTQFGGWPWPADGPVHARERGRFAVHADGRTEEAPAD